MCAKQSHLVKFMVLVVVALGIRHDLLASDPFSTAATSAYLTFDLDPSAPSRSEKTIAAALAAWAAQVGLTVQRCKGDRCNEADVIRFRFVWGEHGDSFPFGLVTDKVAHVVSSKSETRAPEVHFNAARFRPNDENALDIYTVALHEIGHVLGVAHSENTRSIMYPIYRTGGLLIDHELASQVLNLRIPSRSSE